MSDYLDPFSRFAAELRFSALPEAVRQHVGWILADTVAAIVAGSVEPELQALAQAQGLLPAGPGTPTVIGFGRGATAETAAFLNGSGGTFLEMDEGNRFARGHPAIHVLPAALALAEQRALDADSFLSALVCGYEVGSRLGAASQLRSSMHPHGTWGTVGAGAACARALGLAPEAMREVINIASSLSIATSKKTMLEGGLVRNVYAGLSNRQGLLALQLAQCGFTGEHDGPGSLFGQVISERFDTHAVLGGLGSEWHLLQNYFKLHSCCRYNHGALDAIDAIEALAVGGPLPAPEDIAHIQVHSYHLAAELNDPAPRNTLAAKFSLPFAVATRLVHGSSALASFTWEAVRNVRVLALAAKVQVSEDPAMTQRLPAERPARVLITAHDGRQWLGEAGVNRGDDASPYSAAELSTKFMVLCGRVWPREHSQRVLNTSLALAAGQAALPEWLALLRAPPQEA